MRATGHAQPQALTFTVTLELSPEEANEAMRSVGNWNFENAPPAFKKLNGMLVRLLSRTNTLGVHED